ncbi:low affinity iron permease family protein [Chondromyces apiculatus]|uniref:Putative membrane protein n=1 Tax=Chondromyces apiculatus DSM 436 TaxID=1192034 RepID=A0A017T0N6_9BACT|nr:low affinity iron permease family protein [Chondromyces apiculatus]EYF02824.1 putative membrane protein [Chondromyces apiculatus DSM 436]
MSGRAGKHAGRRKAKKSGSAVGRWLERATGTTIVTFLMVFLIQRSQNKDSLAVQIKLNELVAAMKGASNRLIDVEDLSEDELRLLHKHFAALAALAKRDGNLGESHSVEEAETRHGRKRKPAKEPAREGASGSAEPPIEGKTGEHTSAWDDGTG